MTATNGREGVKPPGLLLCARRGTSALLRLARTIDDPATWQEAYWTAIDEAPASECLGIVARIGQGAGEWRIMPVPARLERGSRKTRDVEALARFDGWVYLIGSQYGRPGGPLESRRSFLARFREPARSFRTGWAVGFESPRRCRCRRASSAASHPASVWKDWPPTAREASLT